MKPILNFIDQLGERTNRTDLWVLAALVAFVFALVHWDTEMLLWVMGFMFADLGIEKVTDMQKVKLYAENTRENKSSARSAIVSTGNNSSTLDSDEPTPK